jgi:RNA polymerase-binding transcription factor DksA
MTKSQLERIRQQLLKLKEQLKGDVASLTDEVCFPAGTEASGNLSNTPVEDRAEVGCGNYDEEVAIGLLETEGPRLCDIDAALERIQNATFGHCDRCGQEISFERLKTIPYSLECFECARNSPQEMAASPGNL